MNKHWTADSTEDFQFAVAQDFMSEIERVLEEKSMSRSDLAQLLRVTKERVSQFINNPGNLTLQSMVKWARSLGMKLAVVPYDDGDHWNAKGPIFAGVFRSCWKTMGQPSNQWELDAAVSGVHVSSGMVAKPPFRFEPDLDVQTQEQNLKGHIVALDEPESDVEGLPTLAMPVPGRPLVARIVGNPYQFKSHWIVRDVSTHKGQLTLCGPSCTVCERRKADTLWLVPALVREVGSMRPGFILAQSVLVRKIARALKDKHQDRTDVLIYHRPWSEGMCAVHTNPPEDLPEEKLRRAQLACAHPDTFLAAAFQEANEVDGVPRRPPMLMSANYMEFVPELKTAAVAAKAAAEAYTEEAMLDKFIDEIESGMWGGCV